MVTEANLVKKIQELKKIRPRKDWVVLTKSQILGEEPKVLFFPFFKPALATVTVLGILFGIFSLAQNSLPGDLLYPIKKITEKSQAVFVSEEEKPTFQLKLTNQRLEELAKIVEANQVEKLAPAINEFQASIAQTSQDLKEVREPEKVAKAVVEQTQKLKETKQEIEQVLATKIVSEEVEEEFEGALLPLYKAQVEMLIKDLESRTLNEKQQNLLEGAKEDYEKGNYSLALEKILFLSFLSYPQE